MLLVRIILIFCFANLLSLDATALEFKTEAEKAKSIKGFFKEKEFDTAYPIKTNEDEKAFKRQLLKDFTTSIYMYLETLSNSEPNEYTAPTTSSEYLTLN